MTNMFYETDSRSQFCNNILTKCTHSLNNMVKFIIVHYFGIAMKWCIVFLRRVGKFIHKISFRSVIELKSDKFQVLPFLFQAGFVRIFHHCKEEKKENKNLHFDLACAESKQVVPSFSCKEELFRKLANGLLK